MFNDPIVATMIIIALIAVGEIISIATKARIPMLFTALIGYLVLIWLGIFPKDLIKDSTFLYVGVLFGTAPIIVHMGTLIPLKGIKTQWRAAAIALIGIAFGGGVVMLTISFIFDYKTAVAGIGPITGGIVSTLITTQELKELGFTTIVTIPVVVMAFQAFIGFPITSNLLRRYAKKYRNLIKSETYTASALEEVVYESTDQIENKNEYEKVKYLIPEKYQSQLVLLFMLLAGGAIAIVLDNLTGVPYAIWALAVGIIGRFVNFYPERVMERSNAFSVGIAGIIFLIMASMNDVTFGMFVSYLPQVFIIIILGVIGIIIGGYIGSKLFKWDPLKGIPVALTATFGFPGDYIISDEVSRSVGKTKEEQEKILNDILTPMLVGGFTAVTFGSVVIASILVKTL